MSRLDVEQGETYTVPDGATEEYSGADIDGTLDVDGTLKLVDNPDTRPIDDDTGLDLPLRPLSIQDMNIGFAVFLAGMMGFLLAFIAWVRAYAAGIMLGVSVLVLVLSGLLSIGLELFWACIALTVMLLIAGVVVQWTR